VLLRELSRQRFRPPGLHNTRRYGVSTLERWLGHYRRGGLEALRPGSRATGNARALSDEQRQLIIEIRREYRARAPTELELGDRTWEGNERVQDYFLGAWAGLSTGNCDISSGIPSENIRVRSSELGRRNRPMRMSPRTSKL